MKLDTAWLSTVCVERVRLQVNWRQLSALVDKDDSPHDKFAQHEEVAMVVEVKRRNEPQMMKEEQTNNAIDFM